MNYQNKIFQIIFLLLCLSGLNAQPERNPQQIGNQGAESTADNGGRFDRIRNARQEFLIDQLQLTQKEADAFFPLFWHFDREMRAANQGKVVGNGRRSATNESLTEREARLRLEGQLDREARVLELKRNATKVFLEVIPAVKLIKLEEADREFRRRLLQRMRERKH